jgi:23S rRNA U2552 (ribose-2'-O)-methylase RlmE/FtsJ
MADCPVAAGFSKFCKVKFKNVTLLRPKATRSSSREIYLICEGLR